MTLDKGWTIYSLHCKDYLTGLKNKKEVNESRPVKRNMPNSVHFSTMCTPPLQMLFVGYYKCLVTVATERQLESEKEQKLNT